MIQQGMAIAVINGLFKDGLDIVAFVIKGDGRNYQMVGIKISPGYPLPTQTLRGIP